MGMDTAARTIILRPEALSLGLKCYYTGKPCPKGHLAGRYVKQGQCAICVKERNQRRRTDNPEYFKAWRTKNKRHAQEWKENNRERARQKDRERYARNPEKQKLNHAKWFARHTELARARARAIAARSVEKRRKWYRDNFEKIKAHRLMRRAELTAGKMHVDHIIPLSKQGRNDRRNLQLLCVSCNLKKHARDPIDHAKSLGMLL